MWNKLSMKEKAALIKVAVSNGLTDLDLIKNKYNEFADSNTTTINESKALGGPLLNQNNPIESFNGGRRLPVVRYDDGGFTNTTIEETPYVGMLPEITVNASQKAPRAYRSHIQRQEQNEFNNYIRKGTNNFARPIQDIMLSSMAAPVLNPVTSRVGSYIGTKIPTITRNIGKPLNEISSSLYDILSTSNSIFDAFEK